MIKSYFELSNFICLENGAERIFRNTFKFWDFEDYARQIGSRTTISSTTDLGSQRIVLNKKDI